MSPPSVLVIGGTGGQGMPIVEGTYSDDPLLLPIDTFICLTLNAELAQHGYNVRVLTRDPNSKHAKKLAAISNVSLYTGAPDDDASLKKAFAGVDYAFVNLNSWYDTIL